MTYTNNILYPWNCPECGHIRLLTRRSKTSPDEKSHCMDCFKLISKPVALADQKLVFCIMIELGVMQEFSLDEDYGINQLNMYARVVLKYQGTPDYELRVDRFKQQYLSGIYFNHFSNEDVYIGYDDKSGWQTCPDDWLERHVSDWNETVKKVASDKELYFIEEDLAMSGLNFEDGYEHEDESQGEFAFRKRLADIIQSVRIDISKGHIDDGDDFIMQKHIRNRVYGLEPGYVRDKMLIRAIKRSKEGQFQLDSEGFDLYMDDQ